MPLPATHIRFALDYHRNGLGAINLDQYLSGSIYPDSRKITGIDRALTHPTDVPDPGLTSDSFRRGWIVHMICDHAFVAVTREAFPERYVDFNDDQTWIEGTALKIMLDMQDMNVVDIQRYLNSLNYAENPNGENIDDVRRFYRLFRDLYQERKRTTISDYYNTLKIVLNAPVLAARIADKTEELSGNKETRAFISGLFGKIIEYSRDLDKSGKIVLK